MAVMHPRSEHRVAALQHRAEGQLGTCSEVPDRAKVARDVFGQTNDALRFAATSLLSPELTQHARKQHHLLKVGTLVRVNALGKRTSHEGHRMVLVVALAVAEDWKARQLNPELRCSAQAGCGLVVCSRRHKGATLVDEATEVPPTLTLMNSITLGCHVFLRVVKIGHLQAVWEGIEHLVGVLQLGRREGIVELHGHQACKAIAGIPDVCPGQRTLLISLSLVVALQDCMIEAHACHCAPQRLQSHGCPHGNGIPLFFRVLAPIVASDRQVLPLSAVLHARDEGVKLVRIPCLDPVDQRDSVLLAAVQVLLDGKDVLLQVRNEHGNAWNVWGPEGARHRHRQTPRDAVQAPAHLRIAQDAASLKCRSNGHDGLVAGEHVGDPDLALVAAKLSRRLAMEQRREVAQRAADTRREPTTLELSL
mmetsp:Transcript_10441/g.36656  ORF Transcript_10441/g.36656 Transcript_10441/m.36656 type:complete len:421 (+) Transcript_10441:1901-3163(+)